MSSGFASHLAEDRRLVYLRVLLESPGYAANEFLLQTMVERFGHAASADLVRTDLAWLQEQQLLTVADVGGVQIATLNTRGEDVARGRTTVPGVKRPRAG